MNAQRDVLVRFLSCLTDAESAARRADELLPRFGNLAALMEAIGPGEVSENALTLLRMVPSLSRYRALARLGEHPLLDTCARASAYVGSLYIGAQYERLVLLCLDEGHRLISGEVLTDGALKETPFDARRLLQAALARGARAVILCHNHPSGRAHFSEADVSATRDVIPLFDAVGISVLDHMLEAHGKVKSMRSHLYFPEKCWMAAGRAAIPFARWGGVDER